MSNPAVVVQALSNITSAISLNLFSLILILSKDLAVLTANFVFSITYFSGLP